MPALSHFKLSGASNATLGAFSSTEPLKYELEKYELEGASRVDCSVMTSESAVFDLEGASRADCRDVATGETEIALQGASSLGGDDRTSPSKHGDSGVRLPHGMDIQRRINK